jgi:protein SCO1
MRSALSLKKIIILVVILALPGFLYYLLQEKGKNRYKPLPFYGPKELPGTFTMRRGKKIPDTTYHKVRDFRMANQAGDTVSFPSPEHRITIANFFYTNCTGGCKSTNQALRRVLNSFEENPLIHFISISVDPARDTPAALEGYSKELGAVPGKWDLLTGSQAEVFRLARKDFLLDVVSDSEHKGQVLHSSTIVLIDPQKRIRGMYDPVRKASVDLLIDETKVLVAEEIRSIKNR